MARTSGTCLEYKGTLVIPSVAVVPGCQRGEASSTRGITANPTLVIWPR